jgi:hypothetical protein
VVRFRDFEGDPTTIKKLQDTYEDVRTYMINIAIAHHFECPRFQKEYQKALQYLNRK